METEAPNYTKEHIKKLKINKGLREFAGLIFSSILVLIPPLPPAALSVCLSV